MQERDGFWDVERVGVDAQGTQDSQDGAFGLGRIDDFSGLSEERRFIEIDEFRIVGHDGTEDVRPSEEESVVDAKGF
jgi:hypothetical protein